MTAQQDMNNALQAQYSGVQMVLSHLKVVCIFRDFDLLLQFSRV